MNEQSAATTESITFKYQKIEHPKYKYELSHDYLVQTKVNPQSDIISNFYKLSTDGSLLIKEGYRWDGASGPTIDTKSTMRASCVHDVLYQMIRESQLPYSFKDACDNELREKMIEDGQTEPQLSHLWSKIRAGYFYYAVKFFGRWASSPKNNRES